MQHKKITWLFVESVALTSLLFWVYQFSVFAFGYTLTWQEPNRIIAVSELLFALVSLVIFVKYIIEYIDYKQTME